MSKPTKRKKPMRLWLVRDIDNPMTECRLRLVRSQTIPWLYQDEVEPEWWCPPLLDSELILTLKFDLAPGECVELREVR